MWKVPRRELLLLALPVLAGCAVKPIVMDSQARASIVAPSEFERNIIGWRAGVRATGSERWLVVAADQAMLGQTFEVRLGQNDGRYQLAAAVPVIIMAPVAIPEPRRANGGIISLNGKIVVTASPLRSVN